MIPRRPLGESCPAAGSDANRSSETLSRYAFMSVWVRLGARTSECVELIDTLLRHFEYQRENCLECTCSSRRLAAIVDRRLQSTCRCVIRYTAVGLAVYR